jgi:hypothetical protein
MFVPLASAPLADDGPVRWAASAAGVLPILGSASGTAPGAQGLAFGTVGLTGTAMAFVPVFAIAAGELGINGVAGATTATSGAPARAAFPRESRNSITLLSGALRPGRLVSNQTTGDPE